MIEFGETVGKYHKQLEESRNGFRKGWEKFRVAERLFDEAVKLRQQILQDILKEKGLAVCSSSHYDENSKKLLNYSAEQLGIFPRSQMRLLYYMRGPYSIQGEYEDSTGMTERLELFCPEHFPKNEGWFDEPGLIRSEVVMKGDRFILVVNDLDITYLVNRNRLDIEPNGRKPFLIEDEVYRFFGISDLPKKPSFDSVNRS